MIDIARKTQTLTAKDGNLTEANVPLASDQNCIVIDTSVASILTRIDARDICST